MAHTTVAEAGTTFIHNGDYSGDVTISVPKERIEEVPDPTGEYVHIRVPFGDLKQLVAEYVRGKTIAALERADDDDVLFLEFTVRDEGVV